MTRHDDITTLLTTLLTTLQRLEAYIVERVDNCPGPIPNHAL